MLQYSVHRQSAAEYIARSFVLNYRLHTGLLFPLHRKYGGRLIDKATREADLMRVEGQARGLSYPVRHKALVVSYRAQIFAIQPINAYRLIATVNGGEANGQVNQGPPSTTCHPTYQATISDIVWMDMAVTSPIVLKE